MTDHAAAQPGLLAGESTEGAALKRRMYWLLGLTFIHVVGEGGLGFYEAIRTGSLALLARASSRAAPRFSRCAT